MKTLRKFLLIGVSVLTTLNHPLQAKTHGLYQNPEVSVVEKPQLRTGQLKNGLKYYIKPIKNSNHIQVNLYIKAGSLNEGPDQFAIAHFMEHIALKAGKHISMKMRYDSDMFSKTGIQPNDITAQTLSVHTKFSFDIPAQIPAIETALLFYMDILWGLEFKEEYIDSERSPFLEEYETTGGNAGISLMDTYLQNKITGCSGTPPLDYSSYIWNLKKEPLLRFYKQWYRPENAALVIVGNVKNIDVLEQKIKARFSKMNSSKKTTPGKNCIRSYHADRSKFIKQIRKTSLTAKKDESYWRLYMRNNAKEEIGSLAALKELWIRKLMVNLLNDRLVESTQEYNTHYFATACYLNLINALRINIGVTQKTGNKNAVQKTMGILKTIEQHGISSSEFEQLKDDLIQELGNTNKTSIAYWENEIKNKVAYAEILLEDKIDLKIQFLKKLSLPHFNNALKAYLKEMPEDIGLIAPENHPVFSLSEDTIRSWIAHSNEVALNTEKTSVPLLSKKEIKQLSLSSYKMLDSSVPNVSEYVLANGLKLVFKSFQPAPSVFGDENHIRIHGFSKYGASRFSKEEFYSAINANEIVLNSGVAGKNKFELDQYLKGNDYNGTIHPYIRPYEAGVYLKASFEKLEIALQLIYLYFTRPNYDEEAYKDWKAAASDKFLSQVNQDDFIDKIKKTLEDPYFIPKGTMALSGIAETDLKQAYKIYKQLFGNADDFIFLFSGKFKEKELLRLCRKYLGNLPNSHIEISCAPKPVIPKNRPSIAPFHVFSANENSENVRVKLIYLSPLDNASLSWKDEVKLNVVYNLLHFTLMKELRGSSKQGGPYSVGVGNYNYDNRPRYKEIVIGFGGRPQDIERLIKEAKQVIENLKNADISENMFQTSLKNLYPEKDKFTNLEMQKKMYEHFGNRGSWVSIPEKRSYINSLSLKEVINFATDILQNPPYEFKLLPKKYEK